MRSRAPERRTVPSSTVATSSFSPTARRSSRRPLNAKHEVRAATRRPSMLGQRVQDLVGDAVGEVLVVGAAQVLERQHGDRLLARAVGGRGLRPGGRLGQLEPHVADVARALGRVLAQAAAQDRRARARGTPAGSADQSGSRSRTRAIRSDDRLARERRPPGQALEQHAAERPHVAAPVDRPCRAPARGSCRPRCPGSRRRRSAPPGRDHRRRVGRARAPRPPPARSLFARPKSSTLAVPAGRDHDVAGLEVAVDDAALVRGLDRARRSARQTPAPRAAAARPRGQALRQRSRPRPARAPGAARRPTPRARRSRRCSDG